MSKALYTLRWEDGRLLTCNGGGWGQTAAVVGNWPNANQRTAYGCFAYRGLLYTRHHNPYTHTSYIYSYNGTALNLATSVAAASDGEIWGPPVNYRGRIVWLGVVTNDQYFYVYVFSCPNGTPTLTRRKATELGQMASKTPWSDQSVSGLASRLSPFREQLLWGPAGNTTAHAGDPSWLVGRTGKLDLDIAGSASLALLHDLEPGTHFVDLDVSGELRWPLVQRAWLDASEYAGQLYAVSALGKVQQLNPDTGVLTERCNLLDQAAFQEGTVYTTDTSGTWTLSHTDPTFLPRQLGGQFTILNYNGTAQSKVGYAVSVQETQLQLADLVGQLLPPQPSGTRYRFSYGLTRLADNNQRQASGIYSFEHGSTWYALAMAGGSTSGLSLEAVGSSVLVGFNGTTWTYTPFTLNGSYFVSSGFVFLQELTDNAVHIFWMDPEQLVIRHGRLDLTSGVFAEQGTICGRDNYALASQGLPAGLVCLFDAGDITATLDSVTVDATEDQATLNYQLFCSNANNTATIEVQYNAGQGWQTATRKGVLGDALTSLTTSTTGAAHTFVHDAAQDLGIDAQAKLQYRIRIASQTRN